MNTEGGHNLPENVNPVLASFVEAARNAFAGDLKAIVLYGSAAEGQVRRTSDVNLLLVLSSFDARKAEQLREALRTAQAAIRLKAMFLLESELGPAVEAFAVKFADIARRHRVLFGDDPFTGVAPSRGAKISRLKQTLLNLTLRLREAYIARGLREEQLAAVIADAAGPLRACAGAMLALEGSSAPSPKQALERLVASFPSPGSDDGWSEVLSRMSEARNEGVLEPGLAGPMLLRLIELALLMKSRVEALS